MFFATLEAVLLLCRTLSELDDCSWSHSSDKAGTGTCICPAQVRAFLLDAVGTECFVCQRISGAMWVWGTPKEKTGGQGFASGSRASTCLAQRTHSPEGASPVPALLQGPQGHGEVWAGRRLRVHAPTRRGQLFPSQGVVEEARLRPCSLAGPELMPLPSKPRRRPRDCGGRQQGSICILRSSGKWVSTACVGG